jgi:hypothetical protein
MKPEDVPNMLVQRFRLAESEAPSSSAFDEAGLRHGLAAVLFTVESMVRDDLAAKVGRMKPPDVPTALVDPAVEVFEDQAHENCGTDDNGCVGNTRPYHEALVREALAEVLPKYEQMVREKVAQEIEANPEHECSGAVAACARVALGGTR